MLCVFQAQDNAEPMQTQLSEPQRKNFMDTIDFSFTPNTTQDGKVYSRILFH